ncbi:hypothetical protein JOF58_000523 [Streptomyces cinnamonensis]|nr:hypothetical protein [Streptomyces virginiae]
MPGANGPTLHTSGGWSELVPGGRCRCQNLGGLTA